jgi:hypothetical protein
LVRDIVTKYSTENYKGLLEIDEEGIGEYLPANAKCRPYLAELT